MVLMFATETVAENNIVFCVYFYLFFLDLFHNFTNIRLEFLHLAKSIYCFDTMTSFFLACWAHTNTGGQWQDSIFQRSARDAVEESITIWIPTRTSDGRVLLSTNKHGRDSCDRNENWRFVCTLQLISYLWVVRWNNKKHLLKARRSSQNEYSSLRGTQVQTVVETAGRYRTFCHGYPVRRSYLSPTSIFNCIWNNGLQTQPSKQSRQR